MKKAIKQAAKTNTSSKKATKPAAAKPDGYKEQVFNAEQQSAYNKSSEAKNKKKNTAASES